jgi:hypothetical protein
MFWKILSVVISALSGIAVLLTVIFEGKIKKKTIVDNKIIDDRLTKNGILVVIILFLIAFISPCITYNTIVSSDKDHRNDTIKLRRIIDKLELESIKDSLRIVELLKQSESIKEQVVINAIKELEQQRLYVEKERNNIFTNFKYEIQMNLRKIYYDLDSINITPFAESEYFLTTKLENIYINRYSEISSNSTIINHLKETSEIIEKINLHCNDLLVKSDIINRKFEIRQINYQNKKLKNMLLLIFRRINNLKNYTEYESINFSQKAPEINENKLKIFLENSYLSKIDKEYSK